MNDLDDINEINQHLYRKHLDNILKRLSHFYITDPTPMTVDDLKLPKKEKEDDNNES